MRRGSCCGDDAVTTDIWSWNNAVDAVGTSIESSTGSDGGLEATNVRDPRISKVWRAGDMPVTLTINLPAIGGVSLIGVFGANLAEVSEVTFTLSGSGGVLWHVEVPSSGDRAIYVLRDGSGELDPVNASQLVIAASGAVPLQIGRVWVGGADWAPEVGHSPGSSWQMVDLTARSTVPRSGANFFDIGERLMSFTPVYEALQPGEWDDVLWRMDKERGLASQTLFVPNVDVYDASRFAVLGYLQELPETRFIRFLTAARTMSIVEAG
jgi:hypothetical protein